MAPLLPRDLWEQLNAFLAAKHTGRVEISVRSGRITGFTLLASFQVPDEPPKIVELTEASRKVSSPRQ